jgi:hypothetical protein
MPKPQGGRAIRAAGGAMTSPTHVTLFVYRVTAKRVSAHEYFGDRCLYLGDLAIPRDRMPQVRAGDRIRLRVAH